MRIQSNHRQFRTLLYKDVCVVTIVTRGFQMETHSLKYKFRITNTSRLDHLGHITFVQYIILRY